MFLFLIFILLASSNGQTVEDLCKFCSCSTDLQSINCTEYDVTSQIFKINNTSIQKLKLKNQNFGTLNQKFNFENLTSLDLSYNKIADISDKVFSRLQKLKVLKLSGNGLTELKPNSFQGEYTAGDFYPLRALRTIYLDKNNLKSLNADLFEHTERVEELYLAWNPLEVIDTHTAIAISGLPNLKILDLSYTGISQLPPYFLPRHLAQLILSGNKFVNIPLALKETTELRTLELNDNPIVNLTEQNGFPLMPNLTTLHACNMAELSYVGWGSLANLTALQNLYMAENPRLSQIDDGFLVREDGSPGKYTARPNLKKLYLNDNKLAYLNKSMLANWEILTELDLLRNPWTCECENEWMVETLVPIYLKIDADKAREMRCAAPIEMTSFTFNQLYEKNYQMRCLDYYGAQPEKDAALLVGMLAGILIGIPIILFIVYMYRRHWFGVFDDSPAAFSRQFYHKTNDVYNY